MNHPNHTDLASGDMNVAVSSQPLTASMDANHGDKFDVARFFRGLRQRGLACLFVGGMLAALAAAGIWSFVPEGGYVATALVRVRQGGNFGEGSIDRSSQAAYRHTQQRLVWVPRVLERAVNDPSIPQTTDRKENQDLVMWLEEVLEVELEMNSEIMEVIVTQPDPQAAQAMANAIANSYILESRIVDRPVQYERRKELEEEYARVQEELQKSWEELQTLARNIGNEGGQAGTLREQYHLENYREETRQLRDVRTELRLAKHQLSALDDAKMVELHNAMIERALVKEPEYAQISREINQIERDVSEFLSLGTSANDPVVIRLEQQKSQLEESRLRLADQLRPRIEAEAELTATSQSAENRRKIENQVSVLQKQEASIQESLKEIEQVLANVDTEAAVRMEMLRREIDRRETVADDLWGTLQTARIQDEVGNDVRMLAEAELPVERDQTRKLKIAALGGTFSFLMIVSLIGVIEYRTGRLTMPSEIRSLTQLEVIGTIPKISRQTYQSSKAGSPNEVDLGDWELRESLDAIATRLMYDRRGKCTTVMMTSAMPAEGKSTHAFYVAAALEQLGQCVLLIELDLHLPTLAKRLAMPDSPGVTDVVNGSHPLSAAVAQTKLEGLDFLPSGTRPKDARAVLNDPRFEELLTTLKREYEFIVIDVPPVLATIDATLIGQHVDYSLISVLRNVSKTMLVQTTVKRLKDVGIPIFGAIVGGCLSQARQYGGYYSKYGGGSAYGRKRIEQNRNPDTTVS